MWCTFAIYTIYSLGIEETISFSRDIQIHFHFRNLSDINFHDSRNTAETLYLFVSIVFLIKQFNIQAKRSIIDKMGSFKSFVLQIF